MLTVLNTTTVESPTNQPFAYQRPLAGLTIDQLYHFHSSKTAR